MKPMLVAKSKDEAEEQIRAELKRYSGGANDVNLSWVRDHAARWWVANYPEMEAEAEAIRARIKKISEEDEKKPTRLNIRRINEKSEPKSEPEEKVEAEAKPAEAKWPIRSWDEVMIPEGATPLERLTYVPGLLGDQVEWIVGSAPRPNRMLSLGAGLGVIGTLSGRHIEGPQGLATHLFLMTLGGTGIGKGWPARAARILMESCGAADLLGPGEFVSTVGVKEYLLERPLGLWLMDEFGHELEKINGSQKGNWSIAGLNGLMKILFNSWETIQSGNRAKEDIKSPIVCPAVTIFATATPQAFFGAIRVADLESGFFNRFLILPWTLRRPRLQRVPTGADNPPKALVDGLRRLPRARKIDMLDVVPGAPVVVPRVRMEWGSAEAAGTYQAFSDEVDDWYGTDEARFAAGNRGADIVQRLATIVALGRFSPVVEVEDVRWAIALMRESIEASVGGLAKYLENHLTMNALCEAVLALGWAGECAGEMGPGWISDRMLYRKLGRQRTGYELGNALVLLKKEGRIKPEDRNSGTKPSPGWRMIPDDKGEDDE